MAILVILIRVNLIAVNPRVCYSCHTHCIRFNSSSKIHFVIAEGYYLLNKTNSFVIGCYLVLNLIKAFVKGVYLLAYTCCYVRPIPL